MTALAQATSGLALVMGFGLLWARQVGGAALLLVVQSSAVAITALLLLQQPLMAVPAVVFAAGVWLLRDHMSMLGLRPAPVGGTKPGLAVGSVLAVLCQSQGGLALPLAILLLSIVLAATRLQPLMQLLALVAAQNGLVLAGCVVGQPTLLPAALVLPIACFVLPLPLGVWQLVAGLAAPAPCRGMLAFMRGLRRRAAWVGWIDVGLALAILAATLIVPLDAAGSVFAPLFGLDGVLRSCVRHRRAVTPMRRCLAVSESGFIVLAACAPTLPVAWLAVLAALAMAAPARRWDRTVLAFVAAGLALFGMIPLPAQPSVVQWFSLFAGFAAIAALVPEFATLLMVLILRLALQFAWPPDAAALGIAVAVVALMVCAVLLSQPARSNRTVLLLLGQASIAALAICTGQSDARFAALVLLILLILTRSAARVTTGPVAMLARAGLAGIPPVGVFPGLVLVMLALGGHDPWLLLPIGAALVPITLAGIPKDRGGLPARRRISLVARLPLAIGWLPLVLALLAGYFAPDGLVRWWRLLTAGAV